MGDKGIIASTAGLAILLNEGIGDTIRVSLTPEPGAPREREVEVAQQVLQSMGLRSFLPQVSACPGCGRTTSTFFQEMAQEIQGYLKERMPEWKETHPGAEELRVAVMGCVVNGPGRASTPTSGSACPARSRSRSRRSSSTASSTARCAATGSSPNSSTSWRTTWRDAIQALVPRSPRARQPRSRSDDDGPAPCAAGAGPLVIRRRGHPRVRLQLRRARRRHDVPAGRAHKDGKSREGHRRAQEGTRTRIRRSASRRRPMPTSTTSSSS